MSLTLITNNLSEMPRWKYHAFSSAWLGRGFLLNTPLTARRQRAGATPGLRGGQGRLRPREVCLLPPLAEGACSASASSTSPRSSEPSRQGSGLRTCLTEGLPASGFSVQEGAEARVRGTAHGLVQRSFPLLKNFRAISYCFFLNHNLLSKTPTLGNYPLGMI